MRSERSKGLVYLGLFALLLRVAGAFTPPLRGSAVVHSAIGTRRRLFDTRAATRRKPLKRLPLLARSQALAITDETFSAEVLDQSKPTLVFFSAPWCGPCRMVAPVVDAVIADYSDKIKVVELCTDENPDTVAEYKIRSIPTLMLFSGRKSLFTVVGAVPSSTLVNSIKKHVEL